MRVGLVMPVAVGLRAEDLVARRRERDSGRRYKGVTRRRANQPEETKLKTDVGRR